jgi:hypothetical protein
MFADDVAAALAAGMLTKLYDRLMHHAGEELFNMSDLGERQAETYGGLAVFNSLLPRTFCAARRRGV